MRYFTNFLSCKMRYFTNFRHPRCDVLLHLALWRTPLDVSLISVKKGKMFHLGLTYFSPFTTRL